MNAVGYDLDIHPVDQERRFDCAGIAVSIPAGDALHARIKMGHQGIAGFESLHHLFANGIRMPDRGQDVAAFQQSSQFEGAG